MRYDLKRCVSGDVLVDGLMSAYTEAGFIIVSTFRGGDPSIKRYRKYQINSRSLKGDIQKSEYSYIPVWAGFDVWDEVGYLDTIAEQAFLVFNTKNHEKQENTAELLSLGQAWREKYEIEAFFYAEAGAGGKAHYITAKESIELNFGCISPSLAVDVYFRYLHGNTREWLPKTLLHDEGRIYLARGPNSVNEAYLRRGEIFIRP